jgi:hypothetical protein
MNSVETRKNLRNKQRTPLKEFDMIDYLIRQLSRPFYELIGRPLGYNEQDIEDDLWF